MRPPPIASTSRLLNRTLPTAGRCRFASSDDGFKPFSGTIDNNSTLPAGWIERVPPKHQARKANVAAAAARFGGRTSPADRHAAVNNSLKQGLDHAVATGKPRQLRGPRRPTSPAALRSARLFVAGSSAVGGAMGRGREMQTHDWKPQCPPNPPESVLDQQGKYLPTLDLSAPQSELAITPEETRGDGVASKSWWRVTAPEEPLSANEQAGDYDRWTKSYFRRQAPRTNPKIPSWTEVLDRTLPRNRTMTLGQKRLFAKTVEKLVEGNGVIKSMVGKSYVAPVRWPRKPELQRAQVGQDRLPWRESYKPLIAANV